MTKFGWIAILAFVFVVAPIALGVWHGGVAPEPVIVLTAPPPPPEPTPPPKWTLSFSCADTKWYAAHYTREQLDSMRRFAGYPEPTPAELLEIEACLNGEYD
jgi:hypothetical protein